ncbi:dihydropteroate synthase [Candidatus Woesearchaeota archaeon]|nr:dihydropteroate synthase [Candidatus Woesearchaeota archaeon]
MNQEIRELLHSNKKTMIIGILNATHDSFYDGNKYLVLEKAIQHAEKMIQESADIIDIGGESTRPGSEAVSEEEELNRVIPVIKTLREKYPQFPISIDSCKPRVIEQALQAGATIINDITGLQNGDVCMLAAKYQVPVIMMHMQGTPKNMQQNPQYKDVVKDIVDFFKQQIANAEKYGIKEIIVDPGIGFGKTLKHNLEILNRLNEFKQLGKPLLIGASRKSFINMIQPTPVEDRLEGTLAAHAVAVMHGANIVRVHDVKEHKKMLAVLDAIKNNKKNIIFLGLGTNLGNKKENLARALELLKEKLIIEKISSIYESKPYGFGKQDNFYNQVIKGTTTLSPYELLYFVKCIEEIMGRKVTFKHGPRIIDIDILLYNDEIITIDDLIIPHPQLEKRDFVLIPLLEIEPTLISVVTKKLLRERAEQLKEKYIISKVT